MVSLLFFIFNQTIKYDRFDLTGYIRHNDLTKHKMTIKIIII